MPLSHRAIDGMMRDMSAPNQAEPNTYPYVLQIVPPASEGGSYHWAIRKHGKLHQRSDRKHPTEAKARTHGEAEIERLIRDRGR